MNELVVVGGGKMGEALVGGLLARNWAEPEAITVVEPSAPRRAVLSAAHPGLQVVAERGPRGVDAVLAVKPDLAELACSQLGQQHPPRVLSIAAGTKTESLETWLPEGTHVLRAMPNTPALVGAGAAALAPGRHAADADIVWATSVLTAVGTVVVCGEDDLDAVTGLSGSGPAYVFLLAEALVAAGVAAGLTPEVADALTRQTVIGAARLLDETGAEPARLRADVTSPGGTTAAGLAVFEAAGFRRIVAEVVAAATARSIELGTG